MVGLLWASRVSFGGAVLFFLIFAESRRGPLLLTLCNTAAGGRAYWAVSRLVFYFLDGFSWSSSPLTSEQLAEWLQTWDECRAGDRPAFLVRWPAGRLDLGAAYRVATIPDR